MKVVVAYSGGLDTSVIVKWVKETYNAEVICYCADVGQQEELEGLEAKAIATGASKCIIDDLNEEFARDFIFPMLQGEAIYENNYLLGTSIARPPHRQTSGRSRQSRRCRCHLPRCYRQGQRSGAL